MVSLEENESREELGHTFFQNWTSSSGIYIGAEDRKSVEGFMYNSFSAPVVLFQKYFVEKWIMNPASTMPSSGNIYHPILLAQLSNSGVRG